MILNTIPEPAVRRFTPSSSILTRDYLVMQPLILWMQNVAPLFARGKLVDYGCGNKPYQSFFPAVDQYVGVDVEQNNLGNVEVALGIGDPLPMGSESVDTVLSTQVLEHVPDPTRYLNEAARVLKRGGRLILTCPGAYMLHEEPRDYFRYTEYGLKYLIETCGLKIVRIDTAGGAWRLIGQTYLNHRTFSPKMKIPILSNIFFFLNVIVVNAVASLLDNWNTNTKDTVNYMVVAEK